VFPSSGEVKKTLYSVGSLKKGSSITGFKGPTRVGVPSLRLKMETDPASETFCF
jgi:hypothetical protein